MQAVNVAMHGELEVALCFIPLWQRLNDERKAGE